MRFGHLLPHLHSPHWLTAMAQGMARAEHALVSDFRAVGHATAHLTGGAGALIGGLERKAVNGVTTVAHDIGAAEHAVTHAVSGGARWIGHEVQGAGQAIGGAVSTVTGDARTAWSALERVGSGVASAAETTTRLVPIILAGGAVVLLARGAGFGR